MSSHLFSLLSIIPRMGNLKKKSVALKATIEEKQLSSHLPSSVLLALPEALSTKHTSN